MTFHLPPQLLWCRPAWMMSLTKTIIPYNIGDNAESQCVSILETHLPPYSVQDILAYCNLLQSATLRNATPPVQWCRSALMMTDPYTIGVMPVSSSQGQQIPSRTWFQRRKCLVVRYLRSCVQVSKRNRHTLIYASTYTICIIPIYKRYTSRVLGYRISWTSWTDPS